MENEFWLERWQKQEIGFHQAQYNANLQKHWPGLGLAPGSEVLVPLCGKSLDMAYLAERGHQVLGVELAESAVAAFFSELGLAPEISQRGAFRQYRAGPYTLLAGDFFALEAAQLASCAGVYDRAALIALPEAMRRDYCQHLAKVLPSGCKTLLLTLEYAQEQTTPPPFSIDPTMVEALLGNSGQLDYLGFSEDEVRGLAAKEHGFYLQQR